MKKPSEVSTINTNIAESINIPKPVETKAQVNQYKNIEVHDEKDSDVSNKVASESNPPINLLPVKTGHAPLMPTQSDDSPNVAYVRATDSVHDRIAEKYLSQGMV